jgi:hypothetical protein
VVLGNGLLVVTFALLKGCHGRGEKEWGGGGSSARCHVERGSGGGPRPATVAAGGQHRPESTVCRRRGHSK